MAFILSGGRRTSTIPVADPGMPIGAAPQRHDPGRIWGSQPNVRTVIDFIARNVASIPLTAYEHVGETDRRRARGHPVARLLTAPTEHTPPFRFWHSLLVDFLLYDRWCAVKHHDEGRLWLRRLPPDRFHVEADGLGRIERIVTTDGHGHRLEIDPGDVLFDAGYTPNGLAPSSSPVDALADVLDESAEAVRYRRQVWNNGARVPAVIERPNDAPEWSDSARSRFREDMRAYMGDGARSGGVPILEDGMSMSKVDAFSPVDTQDIEGRQLSAVEVASAFHVPPELVGFRQGNYSNVREYRQQLYRDVLGPLITSVEQIVNAQLVPELDASGAVYVEYNVDAKLRASFEEQAQMMQSAVGAPWLTRNEARAMQNRPALDEADELVTPLNVTTGGLASPRDTGNNADKTAPGVRVKADGADRPDEKAEHTALGSELAAFFDRQSRSVLSRLGAKTQVKAPPPIADEFDTDRWNTELAAVIAARIVRLAAVGAWTVLDRYNPDAEGFAFSVLEPYLLTAAASHAAEINAALYDDLAAAASDPEWPSEMRRVFTALGQDADNRAASLGTEAVNFGATDAAKASGLTYKRWITTASESRPEHAAMHGETQPIESLFSNGGRWPGDSALPPWERVNCRCRVEHVTED